MGPIKKPRVMIKRGSKVNEEWHDKDGTNSSKRKIRKRKLSDMLGSQWSKEELECFYKAYRKYGKNWKKVAGAIRTKSSDMVEALYNMNRAYLSLPEDQGTADAFVAMMTDHYNIMDGSDDEQKTNDALKTTHNPQKRCRGKLRLDMLKESDSPHPNHLQNHSAPSCQGCPPLLKKKHSGDILGGSQPRGKRTPRVPIQYLHDTTDKDNILSPNEVSKSVVNSADDVHAVALALAGTSQREGSPQISGAPGRRTDDRRSSPVLLLERKHAESEIANTNYIDVGMDLGCLEGSLGSREADNEGFSRDARWWNSEGAGADKTQWKVKVQGKSLTGPGTEYHQNNTVRETCRGTEEGFHVKNTSGEFYKELSEGKTEWASQLPRKKSHQLLPRDESSSLDALHTLANMALSFLSPTADVELSPTADVELESSVHTKEQKGNVDSAPKSNLPRSMSMNHEGDQSRSAVKRDRGYSSILAVDAARRVAKLGKELSSDKNAFYESNQKNYPSTSNMQKRKQKPSQAKISKAENHRDPRLGEFPKNEVSIAEGKTSCVRQLVPLAKRGRLIQTPEFSFSSTDLGREEMDLPKSTSPVSALNLPTRARRRRKMGLQKAIVQKELKSSMDVGDNCSNKDSSSVNNKAVDIKDKLSHCLSSRMLRKWCIFEWFYSAIDYPWFAKCEFVNYLKHVRLGHVARLSRAEWSTIRSSLGKPRRFSEKFLLEERKKLEQYRESVRTHYDELRSGVSDGLPSDLARPLSVGQRVIARHPKTGEIHDGSILTVDHNRFRVRFDNPDLGIQFVMDVDCMPLNPWENLPADLRKQNVIVDELCHTFTSRKPDGCFMESKMGDSPKFAPIGSVEIADGNFLVISSKYPSTTMMRQKKGYTVDAIVQENNAVNEVEIAAQPAMSCHPSALTHIQAKETDTRALAELYHALEKQKALVTEFRHMNDEVSGEQKDGDLIGNLEQFKKQYAMLVSQLSDVRAQVDSGMLYLRQRDTYLGNSTAPWFRSAEISGPAGPPDSNTYALLNQDSSSHVVEIFESLRREAMAMVAATMQAMPSLEKREDTSAKIGVSLGSANCQHSRANPRMPESIYPSPYQYQASSCTFKPAIAHAPSPKVHISCYAKEAQVPSELISACVAICLMIQTCAEGRYEPAEVFELLDLAVTSLQPCCPENLPIYREIETYMGYIKNQMLARVPTPSSTIAAEVSV